MDEFKFNSINELYNRLCPDMGEPDSNIVEYAEDVLYMIILLIDNN